MTSLFEYLDQFHPLSESDKEVILNNTTLLQLKKGDYFLRTGQRCGKIGFVLNGILRYFHHNHEGKDLTKYFITPGLFATNLESFNDGSASTSDIQAETDVEMIIITKDAYHTFSQGITHWDQTVKRIIETKLLAKASDKTDMLNQDATTRYLHFMEQYPEVIHAVPLGHIASYLGITQFSLSRIRKNVLQHDFLPNGKN